MCGAREGDNASKYRTRGGRFATAAANPSLLALWRHGARGLRRGVVTSRRWRPWLAQGSRLQSVNYARLAPLEE